MQKQIRTTGIRGQQNPANIVKPDSTTSNIGLSLPIRDHLSAKVSVFFIYLFIIYNNMYFTLL